MFFQDNVYFHSFYRSLFSQEAPLKSLYFPELTAKQSFTTEQTVQEHQLKTLQGFSGRPALLFQWLMSANQSGPPSPNGPGLGPTRKWMICSFWLKDFSV